MSIEGQQSDPQQIFQIITGFWTSQAVNVVARLGIPDLLKNGPRRIDELAAEAGADSQSLYRLMRLLSSTGLFTEALPDTFGPTPTSNLLRSDVPGSLRWFLMMAVGQEHFSAWGNLLHSVRTGEVALDHTLGKDIWQHYAENPDCADVFNRAMTGMTEAVERAVLDSYDFSNFSTIVDVGGGHGGLLSSILKTHSAARGILFDAPQVIANAQEVLAGNEVDKRVEQVGGNFFLEVPAGGDLYILKFILHDWNDEKAVSILRSVRNAIPSSGKLLIVEMVLPSGTEPSFSKFMDINMMAVTGGHERTQEGFRAILAAGGFTLSRIIPTNSMVDMVEAQPS